MLAFVTHPYHRGGVTSWIKEAVLACERMGVPHKIITVRPRAPFISGGLRPEMWKFVKSRGELVMKDVDWQFELGTLKYRALVIKELIEKYIDPGTVLIPSDDEACWIACSMLSSLYRVVGVLHSDDAVYYRLAEKYHDYLSALVSVSSRVKSNTPDYGLPHDVIPCGIDVRQFSASSSKLEKIVWIGRLEEHQKRVTDIPLIAAELSNKRPAAMIEIFGHGDKYDWLVETINKNGLENVSLKGWQARNAIAKSLSEAKILLQTSNFEGMSVAVMEALASGCAVVSTRVSGVEDLETDAESRNTVYLFDTGDAAKAASLIDNCLRNWQPLISEEALQLAKKHFSIEECIQAYLSLSLKLEVAKMQFQISGRFIAKPGSKVLAAARYLKYNISQAILQK